MSFIGDKKIKQVQVLQVIPVELAAIKKGAMFRIILEGNDGGDGEVSDWQVALIDAEVKDGKTNLRSDKLTLLVGKPEEVNISSTAMKATTDAEGEHTD